MKRILILLAALLLPQLAGAETYSWTDRSGTMHFTDNLGAVPAKYRRQALLRATGDDPGGADTQPVDQVAPDKERKVAAPVVHGGAGAPPTARYGNRAATEWQAQFRGLRAELAEIQKKQTELRQEAGDGKKLLNRKQIDELNARNRQLNEQYEAVRQRFNALAEQANQVGLPSEFAQ